MSNASRLSLCMIVKNEEAIIKDCLARASQVVDEIIVVDTGSTDDTIAICESFGATILRYKWNEDFAAARNFGLRHATGDWILWLDADEILDEVSSECVRDVLLWDDKDLGVIGLINYFGHYPVSKDRSYYVQQHRLFRNHVGFQFMGRIHERLNVMELGLEEHRIGYLDVELHHYGYLESVRVKKNKSERNLSMLLRERNTDNCSPWVHYHIASEYNQTGEFQKAYESINLSILAFIKNNQLPPSLLYRLKYETMLSLGSYQGAWPAIDKAIQLYPEYVDLHFIKGVILFLKKRYTLAKEAFEQCLELGDKMTRHLTLYGLGSFQAIYYIGRCWEQEMQYDQAIEAYERSIEACPSYEPAKEAMKNLNEVIANQADERRNRNQAGISISLCMIVRDEEAHLGRCLHSVSEVYDELIIVDTGSIDRTKEIAEAFGAVLFDFEWIDDFSAARSFAYSKATKDYILWLDADDEVTSEQRERLKSLKGTLSPDTDCVTMLYHQAFDANERLTSTLRCNRLVRNHSDYQWRGAINELLTVNGTTQHSDISIIHKRNVTASERNLRIYERRQDSGLTLTGRELLNYANELFEHERYEDALLNYTKYLDEQQQSVLDNIAACCKLSECANKLEQDDLRIQSLYRSFQYGAPQPEVCCKIGDWHMDKSNVQAAIEWYKHALNPTEHDDLQLPPYEMYNTWLPLLRLCLCHDLLGQYQIAHDYNESALRYYPDHPSLLTNRINYMKLQGVFEGGGNVF